MFASHESIFVTYTSSHEKIILWKIIAVFVCAVDRGVARQAIDAKRDLQLVPDDVRLLQTQRCHLEGETTQPRPTQALMTVTFLTFSNRSLYWRLRVVESSSEDHVIHWLRISLCLFFYLLILLAEVSVNQLQNVYNANSYGIPCLHLSS